MIAKDPVEHLRRILRVVRPSVLHTRSPQGAAPRCPQRERRLGDHPGSIRRCLPIRSTSTSSAPQFHVISREQLLELGAEPSWPAYQVRCGRWRRLLPGVYSTHSGPVAWFSRASAALLYSGSGAALSHSAAAFVHEQTATAPRLIDVSIPEGRRVVSQPGLRVHHRRTMPPAWGRPCAVNPADTVVDRVALAATTDDVVGLVTAAVRARTRVAKITRAVTTRPRLRHRALVLELLAEVADGVESPLERRYHRDVGAAHRLPRARLQVRERVGGLWIRADALYDGLRVRVELDGRIAHPDGRTDTDTWRDNVVLIEKGDLTLRYRWRHVAVTPCDTAAQVAAALRARGWTGQPRRCGASCTLASRR